MCIKSIYVFENSCRYLIIIYLQNIKSRSVVRTPNLCGGGWRVGTWGFVPVNKSILYTVAAAVSTVVRVGGGAGIPKPLLKAYNINVCNPTQVLCAKLRIYIYIYLDGVRYLYRVYYIMYAATVPCIIAIYLMFDECRLCVCCRRRIAGYYRIICVKIVCVQRRKKIGIDKIVGV